MLSRVVAFVSCVVLAAVVVGQEVKFEKYKLDNGREGGVGGALGVCAPL
jgi:hypothetical protein